MNQTPRTIEFTERMAGYFIPRKFELSVKDPLPRTEFQSSTDVSMRKDFEFTVKIHVPDLEAFLSDPSKVSDIQGMISDFRFGSELQIEKGYFQLFTKPSASPDFDTAKEMHYTIFLKDREEKKWTFFGFKEIRKENLRSLWDETTTLYFYLWEGHSTFDSYANKNVHALGRLKISAKDFLTQMKSFTTNAPTRQEEQSSLLRYYGAFAETLWACYAPFVFRTTDRRWNDHEFPVNTLQGVKAGEGHLYPLDTRDGLTISLQRFQSEESGDVVLLLHGLTTSTDMYIMPEHQNLVNHLHENGYGDVWSLDWRGSGRFTYNLTPHEFTIDDVARYDIPAAVEFIRARCGADVRIHVVAHCVGSLAFMASYAAGYVTNIASIVANSVSLTPQVPWQAFGKMMVGPEILEGVLGYPYVSPRMPYFPGKGIGKMLYWMERSIRSECKEPACHMVSFMWGWGFPAAFNHRNIHPVTHRRLMDLFGGTTFHYHKHIRKMLRAKAAVSYDMSKNYLEDMKHREMPPTLLISGSKNQIFPDSNKKTFQILRQTRNADRLQYREFPDYGHQDVFMGQYCHLEVFPELIRFLKQHSMQEDATKEVRKLRIA